MDSLKRMIYGWEAGDHSPNAFYRRLYARAFGMSEDELFGSPGHDAIRKSLDEALLTGAINDSALEGWEIVAAQYSRAAHTKPPGVLLHDLGADLADLGHLLNQRRAISTLRRLTRVAAQMAGLMCLTYIKLDERHAFLRWARTARMAAREAGDPSVVSWVLAQEAYGHFYAGDFTEAISVTREAQDIRISCVGAVLAAALEARAQAALGPARAPEARSALIRAEALLDSLAREDVNDSAFGYNRAQLYFHRSNAYTHLGETTSAWAAQEQALALYQKSDFVDRALTRLDRTICLARTGDSAGALSYAADTLTPLTPDQLTGIITLRGLDVLKAIPPRQRALPAAAQLRELLTPPGKERSEQA
ncbi:XRE family transcriptional regulator [Spongiactinospora rosea]|uniref:XRE family transcriptional regulator n=1 Tax=Spongiactinospora rosea TaxID=2248750 RepID=A0A366LT75_9ACTN|nr:XRE family transcriptional regulator [Spongiactinospora rosea]RBQ16957.1 XRE family transcriptional regulator [Spongiactinospora rosea]